MRVQSDGVSAAWKAIALSGLELSLAAPGSCLSRHRSSLKGAQCQLEMFFTDDAPVQHFEAAVEQRFRESPAPRARRRAGFPPD